MSIQQSAARSAARRQVPVWARFLFSGLALWVATVLITFVTGNPALSVPCGMSDGLPIGLMLVGRHFDDATVLRAGHAYGRARGAVAELQPQGR